MPGGRDVKYSEAFIADYVAKRRAGGTNLAVCRELGINHKTGDRWMAMHRRKEARLGYASADPPKTIGQIRQHATARRAYDDFAFFRLKVFGRSTPPWAVRAAKELQEAVESKRREFLCMNVFPGVGKTALMQDFICWLIVRNRSIRIIWGSASDDIADRRVNEIRLHLERAEPWDGNEVDIRQGRAVKPRYSMTELFGRFRPSNRHAGKWTQSQFTVSTAPPPRNSRTLAHRTTDEGPPPTGPTLIALGPKARQIGNRADFIVWDDLWTRDENDNPERGKVIKRFFEHGIETRLQPEGTLALVMQRLGPADLSRYVLDKRVPILDPVTGAESGFEPEYRHIMFPAHHDDLCDGLHPEGREAWDPENPRHGNCLTDPQALPPADYVRAKTKRTWLVEYQQRDTDPQGSIFREIWLTGGRDEDNATFRGCLDLDRGLWELPEDVAPKDLLSAMSVDVGQENYWGLLASVSSRDPGSEMEWVLCADHRRMPAGTSEGLLDWDFERGRFVGVMEEWYQHSKDLGVPFTHVIAEQNAAQRHLFRRTNVVDRWMLARNCRIIGHDTSGKNKNDPKLGVEGLMAIRFQLGAYRIPWRHGEAQMALRPLYNEIVGYKQGYPTWDVLMAAWIRTLNRRRITRAVAPIEPERLSRDIPAWIQEMGRSIG